MAYPGHKLINTLSASLQSLTGLVKQSDILHYCVVPKGVPITYQHFTYCLAERVEFSAFKYSSL